jgi:D-methionine transport system substrate-binding protein
MTTKITSIKKNFIAVALFALVLVAGIAFTSCGADKSAEKGSKENPVIIGVVGASESHWAAFKTAAEAEGVYIDIKDFAEYSEVNPALTDKQLDLNEFQHILYLAKYNVESDQDLVPFAATAVYPISLYGNKSKGITSLEDIKAGDKIAIPNDGTNQSRALYVLQSAGLLKLKTTTGIVTPADIDTANSTVEVFPVAASETAANITDPQIVGAVINNDFVKNLSDDDQKNVLAYESGDSEGAKPYINVWVARNGEETNETFVKLAKIFNTNAAVQAALAVDSGGDGKLVTQGNVPASELVQILRAQEQIVRESK